ncbi:MAG: Clp protease ClpP [Eggerthellaceae bacterium]|nr:Clp protease ClpP [Eggerthellaceae bacterium]
MAIRIAVKGSIIEGGNSWIYDFLGISYTASESFVQQLRAAGGDDVIVEINSPGGYVAPAAEIYEAIRTYPGHIECRVVGQAASAASIIACAAENSITPMGTFFMHNCIGSASGNHNDMRQTMHAMESIDENIMEAYRAKTGMSDEEIYALMEENTTLNARQAVKYGFIDRVTDSAADIAQANSAVTGIAASAGGFVDLMAIDADRLAAMREAYENSRVASGEGGETMEKDNMRDEAAETTEEQAEETEAAEETEGAAQAETEEETAEETEAAEETEGEQAESEEDQAGELEAAYQRGVLAERERISGILDIAAKVPDAMVRAALFTEPISAEQLALAAMRAEDAERTGYFAKACADVDASNSGQVAAEVTDNANDASNEVDMLAAMLKERFE